MKQIKNQKLSINRSFNEKHAATEPCDQASSEAHSDLIQAYIKDTTMSANIQA